MAIKTKLMTDYDELVIKHNTTLDLCTKLLKHNDQSIEENFNELVQVIGASKAKKVFEQLNLKIEWYIHKAMIIVA